MPAIGQLGATDANGATIDVESAEAARLHSVLPALQKSFRTSILSIVLFSALLFAKDPTGLSAWIAVRVVMSLVCAVALGRITRSLGPPQHSLRVLTVLVCASGMVWGLLPLFVTPSEPEWQAVVVLWIFGNQSVMTAVCAPVRSVFFGAVGSVTMVGAATMALGIDRFSFVLAFLILFGGVYSVSIFEAMHRAVSTSISDRLTALRLAASLRVQQDRLTEANSALEELAHRDSLTGLLNRRALVASLTDDGGRAVADGWLGLIDLDRFKQINDTYGHAAGDEVLVVVAHRWQKALGDDAVLGRTGGDEFVFFAGASMYEGGDGVGRLLVDCLDAPVGIEDDTSVTVGCSVGVTFIRAGELLAEGLKRSDGALYSVKALGGLDVSIAGDPLTA